MPDYTQAGRPMRVNTDLEEDKLLLRSFTGKERISAPYEWELELLSEDPSIAASDVLRTPMDIQLETPSGETRLVHGLVRRFVQLGQRDELTAYRAEVVPWLWFLSLSRDCQVFQHKDVVAIVEDVFETQGYSDYDIRCTRSYPEREFCVQYRESHLNFVSRLLEEEGIFYFFEHSEDGHTLVITDDNSKVASCPGQETARMRQAEVPDEDVVTRLVQEHSVNAGEVSLTDYDYLQPSLSLKSSISGDGEGEVRDYHPRRFTTREEGDRKARLLMELEESRRQLVRGDSTCRRFRSGHSVELEGHYRRDVNQEYLLLEVQHTGSAGDIRSWDDASLDYYNEFVAIPRDVPYRPPRETEKPVVRGSQTATVVGKSGEEIWTDKHGRIKVQFHWDREGGHDETSSCWVRVATRWAGKSWGEVHVPRMGQEVVVDFLEGDPDRPLITGSVYNADYPPPYDTGGSGKTKSGMKSRSSKGGGGYNEISIDDKKGEETITVHAEKDLGITVENDETRTVKNDRSTTVQGEHTETVEKNQNVTVMENQGVTVEGDQSTTVEGEQEITVEGDQTSTYRDDHTVRISDDQKVRIGDNRTHKIRGKDTLEVKKKLKIESDKEIELKCGTASITLKKDGSVEIKGMNIDVEAQMELKQKGLNITSEANVKNTLKGVMVKTQASGINTVKGSLVKIN